MSDNNTGSPGYLLPTSPDIPYDDELMDLLQPMFVALTGLDPTMVRPRYQYDQVPNQPEANVPWCAIGCTTTVTDWLPSETHANDGTGQDIVQRSEDITLLFSAYGPKSQSMTANVRDSLAIAQNRVLLQQNSMDLITVGNPVMLPALLHSVWQRRCDVSVMLRRNVERRYGVLTVLQLPSPPVGFGLNNEQYLTPIYLGT